MVKPDKTVEVRDGDGGRDGGRRCVAIDKGLAAGDMVVIDGVDKLQQGSRSARDACTRRRFHRRAQSRA